MVEAPMPKRLGKYDLLERFHSQGGEAEIYKAQDSSTGPNPTLVAIRILRKLPSRDTGALQRHFWQEVKHLERLNGHPFIIHLLDSGWEQEEGQDYPFLVMPWIAGGSLDNRLKKGPQLSHEDAIDYIQQTADALCCAHDNGIIHRDIKPANLLLEGNHILLSDFGIARDWEATFTGTVVGTRPYWAPEQRRGWTVAASDQHALAVTAFQLIAGKSLPLNWDRELKREGLEEALRRSLPERFVDVFMRALNEDPANRFPSMKDFYIEFNRVSHLESTNLVTTPQGDQVVPSVSGTQQLYSQAILPLDLNPPNLQRGSAGNSKGPLSSATGIPPQGSSGGKAHRLWLLRSGVLVLLILAAFFGGTIVDWSPWLGNTPDCLHIVTTRKDSGAGSLRQALQGIPKERSCIISFAPSAYGDIILNDPLIIDHDVTIMGPDRNQVKITPKTPQVTITIRAGYTVWFQYLSFAGLGQENPAQPGSFIQIDGADVTFAYCDLYNFYSQRNGSALSNLYGRLTLKNTTLRNNISKDGGGAIYNLGLVSERKGTLIVDESTFTGNKANYRGGAIYNVGGSVKINGGSMKNNRTLYNDDEIQGGGAIASFDGMIAVSGTVFVQNEAQGYGGAILLVGTDAQVSFSQFQSNQTVYRRNPLIQVRGEGGAIAAETDPDKNKQSYLDIMGNTFQNNIDSFPGENASTQDVAGSVSFSGTDCSTPPCQVITSQSQPSGASVKNLLGYLRIPHFTEACQNKRPSTFAAPASPADGTIICVASNSPPEPFASVMQKPDIQSAVQALCQSRWPQATNVLARLFNYWDPLSWQCFENQQPLGQSVTREDIDNFFCSQVYPGSVAILLEVTSPTAYDWSCQHEDTFYRVKMDTVCQKRAGGHPNAISVLNPKDFTNPNGWQCWGSSQL